MDKTDRTDCFREMVGWTVGWSDEVCGTVWLCVLCGCSAGVRACGVWCGIVCCAGLLWSVVPTVRATSQQRRSAVCRCVRVSVCVCVCACRVSLRSLSYCPALCSVCRDATRRVSVKRASSCVLLPACISALHGPWA